jgi:DNA polymerase IV
MSGWRARELCPQLIFVGGHFQDYQRLGDAAIDVLNAFTRLVERVSIDEAFADVAGCTHLFGSPPEIARAIRRRVRELMWGVGPVTRKRAASASAIKLSIVTCLLGY